MACSPAWDDLRFPRCSGVFKGWFDLADQGKALLPAPKKYPDELRERAVRLYRESQPKPSFKRLAEQLNVHPEALRNWVRQDEPIVASVMIGRVSDMFAENQWLAAENAELRRVNEVLRAASAYFAREIGPTRR